MRHGLDGPARPALLACGLSNPYDRIDPGWRSGTNTDLNDSTDFWRAIYIPRKLTKV